MKTRSDYLRYERAARSLAAEAQTPEQRDYFTGRADLHARNAATAPDITDAERQALETRARHCEQSQAGYFYCGSTENDPCGPGRHPHTGHVPGQCAA